MMSIHYDQWANLCHAFLIIQDSDELPWDHPVFTLLDRLTLLICTYDESVDSDDTQKQEILSKLFHLIKSVKNSNLPGKEELEKNLYEFLALFPSLTVLPDDILLMIASKLPVEDLACMRIVSDRFYVLIGSQSFWHNRFKTIISTYSGLQPTGHAARKISLGTRRLFSLVLTDNLERLRANTDLITVHSLYEFDSNGKNYLMVAQEKRLNLIAEFIISTLQAKSKSEYLRLKLGIALGTRDHKDWKLRAFHPALNALARLFHQKMPQDKKIADEKSTKEKNSEHEIVVLEKIKLIVDNYDRQALHALLNEQSDSPKKNAYETRIELGCEIAKRYLDSRQQIKISDKFINTLLKWSPKAGEPLNHYRLPHLLMGVLIGFIRAENLSLVKYIIENWSSSKFPYIVSKETFDAAWNAKNPEIFHYLVSQGLKMLPLKANEFYKKEAVNLFKEYGLEYSVSIPSGLNNRPG